MLDVATNVGETSVVSDRRRRCIVDGSELLSSCGLRFVIGPGDNVVPDILSKLPGRGLWVGAERLRVDAAIAGNIFSRAARRKVAVTADLSDQVENLLTTRCIELIGLARRAGQAVAGHELAKSWMANGIGILLVQASDGTMNAYNKLKVSSRILKVMRVLRAEELGKAFGRDRVVHVVLSNGGLAVKLRTEIQRLAGFRTVAGDWGKE